jgi:hypothetical protein
MAAPDRGARRAVAGFACGLGSLLAALLAGFLASGAVPAGTSGEGVLLLLAALPVALVGLVLSFQGRRSTSRWAWALVGVFLSGIVVGGFVLTMVLLYVSWSSCHSSCI